MLNAAKKALEYAQKTQTTKSHQDDRKKLIEQLTEYIGKLQTAAGIAASALGTPAAAPEEKKTKKSKKASK